MTRPAASVAKRHRRLGVFWLCNVPPITVAFFSLDFETFVKTGTLYTTIVSALAMAIGHWSNAEAAEARGAAEA